MAATQQALAQVICEDPAVESLSSFIGVDGTNTTLNSGRIQINLKPLDERQVERQRRHAPTATAQLAASRNHTVPAAGAGPHRGGSRQPHAVPVQLGRRRIAHELERLGAATWCETLRSDCPSCSDVASDQQNGGLQTAVVIDRDTASRFGITPQMIDDTLYDAFGQRQVSTIFTQLNQYHVVLEVDAGVSARTAALERHLRPRAERRAGSAAARSRDSNGDHAPLAINHQGQFPAVTLSFNLAPGASLGDAVEAIEHADAQNRFACQHSTRLSGHGAGVSGIAHQRAVADSGRARDGLHRAGRAV